MSPPHPCTSDVHRKQARHMSVWATADQHRGGGAACEPLTRTESHPESGDGDAGVRAAQKRSAACPCPPRHWDVRLARSRPAALPTSAKSADKTTAGSRAGPGASRCCRHWAHHSAHLTLSGPSLASCAPPCWRIMPMEALWGPLKSPDDVRVSGRSPSRGVPPSPSREQQAPRRRIACKGADRAVLGWELWAHLSPLGPEGPGQGEVTSV